MKIDELMRKRIIAFAVGTRRYAASGLDPSVRPSKSAIRAAKHLLR
jgi:hypothetical protein